MQNFCKIMHNSALSCTIIVFLIPCEFYWSIHIFGWIYRFLYPIHFQWLSYCSIVSSKNKFTITWTLPIYSFYKLFILVQLIPRHQLLPLVEVNLLGIRETFVWGIVNKYDRESLATLILSILCSIKKLQQYGNDNFVLSSPLFQAWNILAKLDISQTVHFWKKFTKTNLFGLMSIKISTK